MSLTLRKNSRHILRRILHILNPNNSSQKNVLRRICYRGRYDSRAVDEINPFHQSDILPYFRLSGDRCCGADFFLSEGVDYAALAGVGVADEAYGDLFSGGVKGGELAEEGD